MDMSFPRIPNITKPQKSIPAPCHRCGGTGMAGPKVVYSGRCFRCDNPNNPARIGQDPTYKTWGYPEDWTEAQCQEFFEAEDAKREERNRKARERKAAKEAAKGLEVFAENVARFPVLAEAEACEHHIVRDILGKAHRWAISEAQANLVAKLLQEAQEQAQEAAEAAPSAPVPVSDERQVVEGTVLKTVWKEHDFGSTLKMLLLVEVPEGEYKLWGSAPKALAQVPNGTKVRFAAKVERSSDDESFGFWSRPTKAEVAA